MANIVEAQTVIVNILNNYYMFETNKRCIAVNNKLYYWILMCKTVVSLYTKSV